jgi:hypothetical protein
MLRYQVNHENKSPIPSPCYYKDHQNGSRYPKNPLDIDPVLSNTIISTNVYLPSEEEVISITCSPEFTITFFQGKPKS